MSYLIYLAILIGFCVLIPRIPFMIKSGISTRLLIFFFLVRAASGWVTCFLGYHYFETFDSLAFHNLGLNEYHQLITHPDYFFTETFRDYGNQYSGLFSTSDSFWNNLKTNVIVKTLAVLNLFTLRNFYTNTLVFDIAVFFGSVALFRTFKARFVPRPLLLLAGVFLFPSALFFTSNIHRDGLILMSLGFFLFAMSGLLRDGVTIKRILGVFLSLLLIFSLRNYLAFIIVPAAVAWAISEKNRRYTGMINFLILSLCVLIFFVAVNFSSRADFAQFVVNRLHDFDEIAKVSRTYLPVTLTPDFIGFAKAFPTAFSHAFVAPLVWKVSTPQELPLALEVILMWMFFFFWLLRRRQTIAPVVAFIFFISLTAMVMIGYTIPNLGAIVRYRSIFFQLIFIALTVSYHPRKPPQRERQHTFL